MLVTSVPGHYLQNNKLYSSVLATNVHLATHNLTTTELHCRK